MSMVSDEAQWYVQRGATVQGPYSTTEIGRFLLLGRVRNTDRVSRDGEWWEPVTQVPELIPDELLDLDSPEGWRRLLARRDAVDERRESRPVDMERRGGEQARLKHMRDDWSSHSVQSPSFVPWTLLALSLGVLGFVLYLNSVGPIGG